MSTTLSSTSPWHTADRIDFAHHLLMLLGSSCAAEQAAEEAAEQAAEKGVEQAARQAAVEQAATEQAAEKGIQAAGPSSSRTSSSSSSSRTSSSRASAEPLLLSPLSQRIFRKPVEAGFWLAAFNEVRTRSKIKFSETDPCKSPDKLFGSHTFWHYFPNRKAQGAFSSGAEEETKGGKLGRQSSSCRQKQGDRRGDKGQVRETEGRQAWQTRRQRRIRAVSQNSNTDWLRRIEK